jgi:hypothetical protein
MSLEHYLENPSAPNVCDVFKAGAKDTWARIAFSRTTPRLKIHETTITQNLIYEMNLLKSRHTSLDFELYESDDEKANGNDLEVRVRHADGSEYYYIIQAKIIYHRRRYGIAQVHEGYYKQLKHFVGKHAGRKNQIDLLLRYASETGATPLYLLYNYVSMNFGVSIERELYGCTVISAEYLDANYRTTDGNLSDKVKFSDLHPIPAFPWHELVCKIPGLTADDYLEKLSLSKKTGPSEKFDKREIEDKWLPIETDLPIKIQNDIYQQSENYILPFDKDEGFSSQEEKINPKYLIIIDSSNIKSV